MLFVVQNYFNVSRAYSMKDAPVLVVDDVEAIRTFLRISLLGMEFARVDTAFSAEDALDKCKVVPYGLIFLDINLPNMNGLDLLRELRALRPECKLVMCSGSSTEKNVKTAIDDGAQGFLAKPVTPTNLMALLHRLGYV